MKIKTARRIERKLACYRQILANQVFNKYFYNLGLEETCARIVRHRGAIRNYIKYINATSSRFMRKLHRKFPIFVDLRPGAETYGYKSLEQIEDDLSYISDRFGADFRLQWMLEIPEQVIRLKNEG